MMFNGSYDIMYRISFVTDTNEPVATCLPVRLRMRHLSSAFSVDLELTMINSNVIILSVILGPSFRFLVSIHISMSQYSQLSQVVVSSHLADQPIDDGR
jgi:hypothetical protein